jgi:arylsulfatase A-like enzyme
VLEGSSAREATPLFYFRLRLPVGDQRAQVGAVRDGRWKLKLPQRGYLELFEPLALTQLFAHDLLLFDLEADRGERHDVAAEHPDVVARLTKEIEDFEASLDAPPPVLVGAAPHDHLGWEKMWRGVALAMAVAFGAAVLLLFTIYRVARRLLRRVQAPESRS